MNELAEVLKATHVPKELWPPEALLDDKAKTEEDLSSKAQKAYKVHKAKDVNVGPLKGQAKVDQKIADYIKSGTIYLPEYAAEDATLLHQMDKTLNFATNYGGKSLWEYYKAPEPEDITPWDGDKIAKHMPSLVEQGWGLWSEDGFAIPFESITVQKFTNDFSYTVTWLGIPPGSVVGAVQYPLGGEPKTMCVPPEKTHGSFKINIAVNDLYNP